MKYGNKFIYAAVCAAAVGTAGCSDYLETSSPSVVDGEFVFSNMTTARAAMDGAYEAWRAAAGNVFAAGLFYAADLAGSDIERHPESYTAQPARHRPEGFYENGTLTSVYDATAYANCGTAYNQLYDAISKSNAIITAIENASFFESIMADGAVNNQSELYGEAVACRATAYRELIRYYGDVPFNGAFGVPSTGMACRDSIYDVILESLIKAEPHMYRIGENGTEKNQMSRTYVQGLIARIALDAGGYQTRRSDVNYVDGKGNPLTFETKGKPNANAENAVYGRRSDWKAKYELAKKYFGEVIANSGTARYNTVDPRKADVEGSRAYGNPYQYFFQQMHIGDEVYADESIYEIVYTKGTSNERPYSSGRPSSGGNRSHTDGYPCKAYGQARIVPAYYYGVFDPNDMRRDVSVTVTGSSGKGVEKMIPVKPNSKSDGGGMSLSKFDENRVEIPWNKQRNSGINGPYMRMAEIYLGYAEACAALGESGPATQYLKIVRQRSFPTGLDKTEARISSLGLLNAIIEERGFEFAGEGDRRWTLIRTGLIGEKIKEMKSLLRAMVNGLKANGSYTFENGNTISDYVYTKLVDAKSLYGYRLTAQTPAGKENDPVLYPGWRGQHDDWTKVAQDGKYTFVAPVNSNLAIQGLFKPVEDEAALLADGYEKFEWGKAYVDYENEYVECFFKDYDFESAPIYLWPFTPNTILTSGLHNGYGFPDK